MIVTLLGQNFRRGRTVDKYGRGIHDPAALIVRHTKGARYPRRARAMPPYQRPVPACRTVEPAADA
jgi:hypothetical protein